MAVDTAIPLGPVALTTSAATIYTVPGSTVGILRQLVVCNETGSAATFTVSSGVDAAGKRLWKAEVVQPNSTFTWEGFLPLPATRVLQAYAGTSSALTLSGGLVEVS